MALSADQIEVIRPSANHRACRKHKKLELTDWQLIEDTNSAEIVSDPYRRTQQDKEMDKAHFLLDLNKNLIRFRRTEIARTYVPRHS